MEPIYKTLPAIFAPHSARPVTALVVLVVPLALISMETPVNVALLVPPAHQPHPTAYSAL